MPKLLNRPPKYSLHKPSGQAKVRYNGKTTYLGKHGTQASLEGYPTVARLVANLWREIRAFVRSGGKLAPKTLRKTRLAVCERCDKWDTRQRRCRSCGCKADAKVYSLVATCPLDKWPKQEGATS